MQVQNTFAFMDQQPKGFKFAGLFCAGVHNQIPGKEKNR
jgi:hypothetical protein